MRPVIPEGDFPPSVQPVKFLPPEGMEENIEPIAGLMHHDEDGNPIACEFMFELTKEEIQTLRHEPFISVTILSDVPAPFSLSTTYPYEEKYAKLMEHHHICTFNLSHDTNKFWKCDNPSHNSAEQRLRECDSCFQTRHKHMMELVSEDETMGDTASSG